MRISVIILAGGSGRRMGNKIPKQYLPVLGRPLLYYPLKEFEKSRIDEIILVTQNEKMAYCQTEIVEKYQIKKVKKIVPGGKERYQSVQEGLKEATGDYVLIHDGARAFITEDIIERIIDGVQQFKACIAAMPVKDTIKTAGAGNWVEMTPPRETLWMIQTPQAFETSLIKEAYRRLQKKTMTGITDDAMVVENMMQSRIKLIEGSYENIKVTTPEDLLLGEMLLSKRESEKNEKEKQKK